MLAIWVHVFNFIEFLQLTLLYYPFYSFFYLDCYLHMLYFWRSPFKEAKSFALDNNQDPYAYGETALISLAELLKKLGLKKTDCFYELGCGSARACFFVRQVFQCRVVGVDWNPVFITKARKVKERFRLGDIDFWAADFSLMDFKKASFIYLYGTCLDESAIKRLIQALIKSVKKDCKIITVSFSLNHYLKGEELFEDIERYKVRFVWGTAEVFIQKLK
ncbi:MAG: methyltransferase domain-containing protein [Chlamydiales bacterium]|nr:methyltransferase domain-containing protein [Chlamydiales bacterium]